MTEFDFDKSATRIVKREVAASKLRADYVGMAEYYNLDADSDSTRITDVAREITVYGAHLDGTVVGGRITLDDVKGGNPGEDSPVLPYWMAARAIRIGLVRAVRATDPADKTETDWLRLVRQAAENAANKGGFDVETILTAAKDALTGK